MSDLTQLSVAELANGYRTGSFSALDVTNAYLERAERFARLNAFIQLTPEAARQSAKKADEQFARKEYMPLLGVPVVVKDNINVLGTRTTCGSKMLANYESLYDATVTTKLKQAGSVLLGKTNMDEFAMGSSTETSYFGPAKNPWDETRVPGGTSGGSAIAVAAALAPLALGTDTGGSVRQPSSFCSVVGLKPTYGRVSRYGVVAHASSLDQVGQIARTVTDCAELAQLLFGKDPYDATSVAQEIPPLVRLCNDAAKTQSVKGLRIGLPKEFFIKELNKNVEQAIRAAVATLESLGASAVPVSLPNVSAAIACYYIIAPAEASSNLARFDGIRYGHRAANPADLKDLYTRTRSEGFGKEVRRRILVGTYVLSTGYYDAFYARAQRVRTLVARDFANAFEHCDVIAAPTAPTTAFKIGEKVDDPVAMYLEDVFTIPVSLAGLPALNVPCGFDPAGLPIGMQLIGRPWEEAALFKTAATYESVTEWHNRRPPLS